MEMLFAAGVASCTNSSTTVMSGAPNLFNASLTVMSGAEIATYPFVQTSVTERAHPQNVQYSYSFRPGPVVVEFVKGSGLARSFLLPNPRPYIESYRFNSHVIGIGGVTINYGYGYGVPSRSVQPRDRGFRRKGVRHPTPRKGVRGERGASTYDTATNGTAGEETQRCGHRVQQNNLLMVNTETKREW
ncbi:hypothetical protein B0H14DRAFT_3658431 [Mycena olivaceomarginata]|nr:hypothetical protein B0H14DRAFT_3658431 [Mycena olivaceomarginata]